VSVYKYCIATSWTKLFSNSRSISSWLFPRRPKNVLRYGNALNIKTSSSGMWRRVVSTPAYTRSIRPKIIFHFRCTSMSPQEREVGATLSTQWSCSLSAVHDLFFRKPRSTVTSCTSLRIVRPSATPTKWTKYRLWGYATTFGLKNTRQMLLSHRLWDLLLQTILPW
jgi:hypothetical protein